MEPTKAEIKDLLQNLEYLMNNRGTLIVMAENDGDLIAAIQGTPKDIAKAIAFAMSENKDIEMVIRTAVDYLEWKKKNSGNKISDLLKILTEAFEESRVGPSSSLKCQDCEVKDNCEVREVLEGKKPFSSLFENGVPKEGQMEELAAMLKDRGYKC
jgi:hypothetical protein